MEDQSSVQVAVVPAVVEPTDPNIVEPTDPNTVAMEDQSSVQVAVVPAVEPTELAVKQGEYAYCSHSVRRQHYCYCICRL